MHRRYYGNIILYERSISWGSITSIRNIQPMLGGTRELYVPVFVNFAVAVLSFKASVRKVCQRMQKTNPDDSERGNPTPFPSVRALFHPLSQCASLLCEHDLVPVLGVPRLAAGIGGPTGTVTTSFLVREVDVLAPGSLLLITAGEGCTPGKSCPSVTVAEEIDYSVALGHEEPAAVGGLSGGTKEQSIGWNKRQTQRGRVPSPAPSARSDNSPSSRAVTASVLNEEEVLVDMMDAETGLCLGKRVPVGELRHSTSFFGLKLDSEGTTVKQVCPTTNVIGLICSDLYIYQ